MTETQNVKNEEERPGWLGMVPVKRYQYFTRFFKSTNSRGDGYCECFLNSEIDAYNKKRGIT